MNPNRLSHNFTHEIKQQNNKHAQSAEYQFQYQQDPQSVEFQLNMIQEENQDAHNHFMSAEEKQDQQDESYLNNLINKNSRQHIAQQTIGQHSQNIPRQQASQQQLFKQFQKSYINQSDKKLSKKQQQINNRYSRNISSFYQRPNKHPALLVNIPNPNNVQMSSSMHLATSEHKLYQQYKPRQSGNSDSESQRSEQSFTPTLTSSVRRTMIMNDDFYGMNQYSTVIDALSSDQVKIAKSLSRSISELQSLIKRESLLFEYEDKTKNQRIKQIEFSYVNVFSNYIGIKNVKASFTAAMHLNKDINAPSPTSILLNNKDLTLIDEGLLGDLKKLKDVIVKEVIRMNNDIISKEQSKDEKKNILKSLLNGIFQKPPESFFIDINNFFPNWVDNIRQVIEMEFESTSKIQYTFESQYSLPSKMLSSLKYRDNIYRFCEVIFKKPLEELKKQNIELNVDFSVIYQKWSQNLFNIPNSNLFKQFIEAKLQFQQTNIPLKKSLIVQLSKFFNQRMQPLEYEKILVELNHFAKNRNALNFLIQEIGHEEIEASINLRLALLVYKKIQINRRKLQQLSLLFINQILDNYDEIPQQIKYVVRLYKKLSLQKLVKSQKQNINESEKDIKIKYEDLKSFFNKIIFSQIFFATFMSLYEEHSVDHLHDKQSNQQTSSSHSYNFSMIALISQKIMFGQEFYEKFKYGWFNTCIKQYSSKIMRFIQNFGNQEDSMANYEISYQDLKEVECVLLSLESIKYWYQLLKNKGFIDNKLQSIEKKLMYTNKNELYSLGTSSRYSLSQMYVMLVVKSEFNYSSVFKPKHKFKKTFIEFLSLIQSINQGITFHQILEQYKIMQASSNILNGKQDSSSKPSILIYANYISLFYEIIQKDDIVETISKEINNTKSYIQKVKIRLEKQHNRAINLQKFYLRTLNQKKTIISKQILQDYVNMLMLLPLQFDYYVEGGKIYQTNISPENMKQSKKKQRMMRDCLNDIAQFFGQNYQGLDALYHILFEKIMQEIQKQGIKHQNMAESVQQVIGQKLYKMTRINQIRTKSDIAVYKSMKTHKFVTLNHLGLNQYTQQQQIILQLSLPLLQQLQNICSPDQMLRIFEQVSMEFQNIISCVGKASDMTSDVQIPMMEYILLKSNLLNLHSLIEFIKIFAFKPNGSNKQGMLLTLIQSICYLIQRIDQKQLGLQKGQYQRIKQQNKQQQMQ